MKGMLDGKLKELIERLEAIADSTERRQKPKQKA